jgi:hypothetical protein
MCSSDLSKASSLRSLRFSIMLAQIYTCHDFHDCPSLGRYFSWFDSGIIFRHVFYNICREYQCQRSFLKTSSKRAYVLLLLFLTLRIIGLFGRRNRIVIFCSSIGRILSRGFCSFKPSKPEGTQKCGKEQIWDSKGHGRQILWIAFSSISNLML